MPPGKRRLPRVEESAVLTFVEDRYNGVEIQVLPDLGEQPHLEAFEHALRQRIRDWVAAGKGGLWLHVPLSSASVVGSAAAQGFAFHHAVPDNTELVYVCDQAGMTPAYATSIEGATGVVFSPDEEKILSVWERGGWNTPGGAVDPGEMKIEALARECREEVGIALDPSYDPVYLGG